MITFPEYQLDSSCCLLRIILKRRFKWIVVQFYLILCMHLYWLQPYKHTESRTKLVIFFRILSKTKCTYVQEILFFLPFFTLLINSNIQRGIYIHDRVILWQLIFASVQRNYLHFIYYLSRITRMKVNTIRFTTIGVQYFLKIMLRQIH